MRSDCTSKTGKPTTTKWPNRNLSACLALKSRSDAKAAASHRPRNRRSARKEGVSTSQAEWKPHDLQGRCGETCHRAIPCPEDSPPETAAEYHARRRKRTGGGTKLPIRHGEAGTRPCKEYLDPSRIVLGA